MSDEFDRDDRVWKLLGKARPVTVPHRFSADVIRALRQQEGNRGSTSWVSLLRWILPGTAAAAAAICLAMAGFQAPKTASVDFEAEFREAAELDNLVASSAGWAWHEVAP